MRNGHRSHMSQDLMQANRARIAVAVLFLANGFVVGSWAPHVPFAKLRLDVDVGLFGAALLALAVGGLVSMPFAGWLVGRWGSTPVIRLTALPVSFVMALPVLAPDMPTFVVALFLTGAAGGAMDVAMNAHGIAIERTLRRPIMSSLHGMFSVGGFLGAAIGGAFPLATHETAHVAFVCALTAAMIVAACVPLLPASVDIGKEGEAHFAWPSRATLGVGMLCFLALMLEGAVLDWAALQLGDKHPGWLSRVGWGFSVYCGGMAIARFSGDALRLRLGAYRVIVASGVIAALGMLAAALSPWFGLAIVGYGLAGLGIGNMVPILFAGGARLEPAAPSRGIAAVTTFGYTGFLFGPPLIGMAAQVLGLSPTVAALSLFAVIIVFGATLVRPLDRPV